MIGPWYFIPFILSIPFWITSIHITKTSNRGPFSAIKEAKRLIDNNFSLFFTNYLKIFGLGFVILLVFSQPIWQIYIYLISSSLEFDTIGVQSIFFILTTFTTTSRTSKKFATVYNFHRSTLSHILTLFPLIFQNQNSITTVII